MWLRSVLEHLKSLPPAARARRRPLPAPRRKPASRKPQVEALEDRCLLSFNPAVSYPVGPGAYAVAAGDVNGDTRPDLVTANYYDNSVSVLQGNPDGTFGAAQNSATGAGPHAVAVGDFDGDGKDDVVTANAGDLSVLLHNPDGTLATPQGIFLPNQFPPDYTDPTPLSQSPLAVAVGDIDKDGNLDLAVTGFTAFSRFDGSGPYGNYYTTVYNGYVNVLLGDGHGGFGTPNVRILNGLYPNAVALGKFDGDIFPDVVTADAFTNTVSVLPGNGNGTLGAPADFGTGYSPHSVAVGDLDGDGQLDLVTANSDSSVSVLLRNPDGSVRPAQNLYLDGSSAGSVAVGDVNQNGKLDLVATTSTFHCTNEGPYGCYEYYYSGEVKVLLGYGEGSFALPRTSTLANEYAGYGLLGNFDGDAYPDVAATIGSGTVAVATNAADWVLPSAVRITDATVIEGNAGTVNAVFTVTRLIGDSAPVTISYTTQDGTATAGSDYVFDSGTRTFAPGQTSLTISVPVNGDRLGEPDESFYLLLGGVANADILDGVGVGTIVDDEPRISIGDMTVTEGNAGTTAIAFTVSLSAPSDAPVSVTWSTSNGSAAAGSDYVAVPPTTLTFAPNQTSQPVTVQVNGDIRDEYDEYFYVNLSSPTNGYILGGQGVGTILDNDPPPTLSINDASIREGDRGTKLLSFTVRLSAISDKWVSVNFATADGTAKTSDNDYVAKSGTLYFAPGVDTMTITITITGDRKKEPDETFHVILSGAAEATIADGDDLGTILDDEPPNKGGPKK